MRHPGTRRFVSWLVALTLSPLLLGGHAVEAELFDSAEPLRFRLEAPFGAILRQRTSPDPEYQNARLFYTAQEAETALDLRVRVRGKSRRVACDFPPLLLNFPNKGLDGTWFEGENRLKLVTHCDANASYDQYLLLEYLSYKVLNLLTDASLRVRLVEVAYFDSERQRELSTRPAILIEDEEKFAERKDWQLYEQPIVERARYDAAALGIVELFQYFIGNTDWSALRGPDGDVCCHNVVPYASSDDTLWPVPYDFDSAGIVDAPHALPNERLPIRDVRQRLYRGSCRTPAEIQDIARPFQTQRAAITDVFRQQPGLREQTLERTLEYVDQFYATLGDPRGVERMLAPVCR